MRFSSPSVVEQTVWNLKVTDLPRSERRALINRLFNGEPPYSREEVVQNRMTTNVNFLEAAKISHDARRQYSNAFLTPGNFFSVALDYGKPHKRQEWSGIITQAINRRMKRSRIYRETLRNVFAQNVLHGVGPVVWDTPDHWCPLMQMAGDVLVPSATLLTMENLNYFAVYRRYTGEQLMKFTRGPSVDPGWDTEIVDKALEWCKKNAGMTDSSWDATYSPERRVEMWKSDTGQFACDAVPTINCFDFFYFEDEDKREGWRRMMVLDTPELGGDTNILGTKGDAIYDSNRRKNPTYAEKHDRIIHWQFADASAVAPFRYHSVRSLGWLLYAVCHLQNRMRCRFTDSVFESLLQYIQVRGADDDARLEKVDLLDKGVIPEGLEFVKQQDRWQVNAALVESAMSMNRQSMADNSSAFTQDFDYAKENQEKTATEIMAQVNATTAMVGAMLQEAYSQQEFQYREIARRFCLRHSNDMDVMQFRNECLSAGIPEKALNSECWDISAERVMGGGNKQLEISQAQALMGQIVRFAPESQQKILSRWTFAMTSDAALTNDLVPVGKLHVSDATHDAELTAGVLLQGQQVSPKTGQNYTDYIEALLKAMATSENIIRSVQGNMATQIQIIGLKNIATHIDQNIQLLAQDQTEKQKVTAYTKVLGKLANEIKGYEQRLQKAAEAQQQAGGANGNGDDGKAAAAILMAQTKAKIKEAEAVQKLKHKDAAARQQNAITLRNTKVQEAATDLRTSAEIKRGSAKQVSEAQSEGGE